MARTSPRRRHLVSAKTIWLLKACGFRYSHSRDAYVLRLVGNRIGPVYKVRPEQPADRRHQLAQ